MPLWFVVGLFAVLIALQLGAVALFLWLGTRWWNVPNVSFRRAMATTITLLLWGAVILAAEPWIGEKSSSIAPAIALLVLGLGGQLCIIKWILRARIGKAVLMWLVVAAVSCAFGLAPAFAIRASLLETFVVPTGSMAPTILGSHSNVLCNDCGFSYAVGRRPMEQFNIASAICPNCGSTDPSTLQTTVLSGDRIFVEKRAALRRWGLIVFRPPDQPQTLFVSRLIGLPRETAALSGGHIYVDGRIVRRDLSTAVDLWQTSHDTRFFAHQVAPKTPHWQPAADSKWRQNGPAWSCDASDGDGGELQLQGDIVDRLAYNSPYPSVRQQFFTGDIKLDCSIDSFDGDGKLLVRWDFDKQSAVATIGADGKVSLDVVAANGRDHAAQPLKADATLAARPSRGQLITFAVRDGRAYVCQDGKTAVSIDVGSETLADQSEEPPDSGCRLAIGVQRCKLAMSRLLLSQQIGFRTIKEMGADAERHVSAKAFGSAMKLGADEYLVLGDNTEFSRDSRFYGPIKRKAIIGVARWIYWPVERWHEFQ
ncbi:MAG TPA: S26 family signal peptidase [Pirellulales bacterium]|jgi:signal peptidase I|nr:S26 family signal peptidase [Pirellulales bacterium]